MGWLRQLMLESEPPIRSFGALARAALGSPLWPKDASVQPRSLAAVFSKLDRQVDLEWLTDRPTVQQVLVALLGCSPSELPGASRPSSPADEARVRLADLPYARGLDLRVEPPPPGPPVQVLSPSRWGRVWWHAPSGSGRSLVGRYLRARGQADFMDVLCAQDVPGSIPEGPVFLELHGLGPASLLHPVLQDRCCVAAPFWPEQAGIDGEGFVRVPSASPTQFLPALVDWVAQRLPSDTRFESQAALAWLLEEACPLGLIDSPGAALGLCGLLDEQGVSALRGQGLSGLAGAFVLGRLARVGSRSPERSWFRETHLAVLETLAEQS